MGKLSLMIKFPQYLEREYLRWQQQQGGRKTVAEFAAWLGVKQSTVSMWWNGNSTPRDDSVIRNIAKRLGMEVYDVLEMERPDPDLAYIDQVWGDLSPKERKAIREQAEKYRSKK